MAGEILRVDTELLTGSVFAPFMTHMRKVVDEAEGDIKAIGPLVPRRVAEIDDNVIDLQKQTVPLVLNLLTSVENLPRGNAESVDALAAMLKSVEETNTTEAVGFRNPGNLA